MPVFLLPEDLPVFPDPRRAEPEGMLAVGGGLEPARVLLAYSRGIFPWNSADEPLTWWCPAPRMVVQLPGDLHVPRTLRKQARRRPLRITLDHDFPAVLGACASIPRPGQDRGWMTPGIVAVFTTLHELGLAHSVEAWDGDTLVGGLYGLALGAVFFGESMFSREPGASKQAFVTLARQLARWGFELVDCQVASDHLRGLGGQEMALEPFLAALERGLRGPGRLGPWQLDPDLPAVADDPARSPLDARPPPRL